MHTHAPLSYTPTPFLKPVTFSHLTLCAALDSRVCPRFVVFLPPLRAADCQSTANKQKVMKPCKPNPSANNPSFWACNASNKKVFEEIFKRLAPKSAAAVKRKAAEKESESASAPPARATFRTKDLLPGVEWEMTQKLLGGAVPKLEVIDDRMFLRVYKRARTGGASSSDEVEECGGDGGDGDGDDDGAAADE